MGIIYFTTIEGDFVNMRKKNQTFSLDRSTCTLGYQEASF